MQAIIETGGKQYKVSEGSIIYIEKLDGETSESVVFNQVLAVFEDDKLKVGAPYLDGVSVEGKVVKQGKNKKILVYKMNAKKNYRRRKGHRQPYTKIQIDKLNLGV